MTEQEWLVCGDPMRMLNACVANFHGLSDRKLSLFAEGAGCEECRRLMPEVEGNPWEKAAYVATADCGNRPFKAAILRCIVGDPFRQTPTILPEWLKWSGGAVRRLAEAAYQERYWKRCYRCNGAQRYSDDDGNIRCPDCAGEGRTGSGLLDPTRLMVTADALEEAGCCDAALLGHLRGPGPHIRGCWAVDLLTGRG